MAGKTIQESATQSVPSLFAPQPALQSLLELFVQNGSAAEVESEGDRGLKKSSSSSALRTAGAVLALYPNFIMFAIDKDLNESIEAKVR